MIEVDEPEVEELIQAEAKAPRCDPFVIKLITRLTYATENMAIHLTTLRIRETMAQLTSFQQRKNKKMQVTHILNV